MLLKNLDQDDPLHVVVSLERLRWAQITQRLGRPSC
jgi:hypothetical protein